MAATESVTISSMMVNPDWERDERWVAVTNMSVMLIRQQCGKNRYLLCAIRELRRKRPLAGGCKDG